MRSFLRFAVLLAGIGIFTLFFDDVVNLCVVAAIYGARVSGRFAVPALRVFAGWVAEHVLVGRMMRILILAVPILGTLRIWLRFHRKRIRSWWSARTRGERFAIALVPAVVAVIAALFAGSILGLFAVAGLLFPRLMAFLTEIGSRVIELLAKTAAMRWVEPWFDAVWKRIPRRPRKWAERKYAKLWYRTMFTIARTEKDVEEGVRKRGFALIVILLMRVSEKARRSR